MNIGIVGYGEIGKAIEGIHSKTKDKIFIKDINGLDTFDKLKGNLHFLHICFPYSGSVFVEKVSYYINKYNPEIVIIHSTVVPETTKKLFNKFGNVVHSPVRGKHPKLAESILKFRKYIGTECFIVAERVKKYFKKLGIKDVCVQYPSVTTEIAKLLDTTYYGICIAFHAYADKLSKKYDVDHIDTFFEWNLSYNDGYVGMKMPQYVRPTLIPPKKKIGGHCVVQNAILLSNICYDPILDNILKFR